MSRKKLALTLVPATLALGTACRHDDGQASSTTTIRSGTPDGVRVTNTPPRAPTMEERAADRLAAALCAHRRDCAAGRTDVSPEALLLDESVCTAELKAGARRSVAGWGCSPATARSGLEECLAAVKAERCRDVVLEEATTIDACRAEAICGKGAGSTML